MQNILLIINSLSIQLPIPPGVCPRESAPSEKDSFGEGLFYFYTLLDFRFLKVALHASVLKIYFPLPAGAEYEYAAVEV